MARRRINTRLAFKEQTIDDAIACLKAFAARGYTHATVSVTAWEVIPPRAPKKTAPVRERATPGKIRPNGVEGTVRDFS